mmetsp:Transcript_10346/g.24822  ORF Transcript_10346/g.24822 Transcript_10346/m.24822 type:complete len:735 (-) Transcript_10346:139-2343(-)
MLTCQVCGSTETDYDPAKGDTVCVQCGTVIEENTIVSEVQFAEDANGASSVVGQFISSSGAGMMSSSFAKESREITISNGRRKISHIAGALSLNSHHVEAAQRFFLLAVQHNFIQGRRTQHVVAACLYIVCRREKTPHMLIDFSDVLQTNVYSLGSTFLKFTRLLNLQLPLIDPSLYIHRFASRLELGDKMHVVSMLALRLVQRMKRDWIQTGRRPSGICGAALLIAARVHGFRRTQRELVHVVRICDVTLRKRLCEFEDTACGALTARELGTADLDELEENDPPAFTAARRLDAVHGWKRMLQHVPTARAFAPVLAQPCGGKRIRGLPLVMATPVSSCGLPVVRAAAASDETASRAPVRAEPLQGRIGPQGQGDEGGVGSGTAGATTPAGAARRTASPTGGLEVAGVIDVRLVREAEAAASAMDAGSEYEHQLPASSRAGLPSSVGAPAGAEVAPDTAGAPAGDLSLSVPRRPAITEPTEEDDDLSALSDGELDGYIITDTTELQVRSELWTELNHDWLIYRAEKDAQQAAAAAAGGEEAGEKRPRKKQKGRDRATAATAAEAVESELRRKRVSTNLNYEVLSLSGLQQDILAGGGGIGGAAGAAGRGAALPGVPGSGACGDAAGAAAEVAGGRSGHEPPSLLAMGVQAGADGVARVAPGPARVAEISILGSHLAAGAQATEPLPLAPALGGVAAADQLDDDDDEFVNPGAFGGENGFHDYDPNFAGGDDYEY